MVSEKCSVCTHSESDHIDAKLAAGATLKSLSERYGMSQMALSRHRKKHLPQVLVQKQSSAEGVALDLLLQRIESLYKQALEIMEAAKGTGKYTPAIGALREARMNLELTGKLIGELKTGTTINLNYNQEFIQVRTLIVDALQPHPEARQAVLAALDEGGIIDVEDETAD